ncbi:MAG: GNAT family N-acetyltransferase [Rudaea sp.]
MIPRTIAISRLRLRALAMRDLALFRNLYGDAETMRHIGRPMPSAQAAGSLRATINAARNTGGPYFFVIVEGCSERSIGLCSIRGFSARTCRVEAGLMLLRAARGQGYATEALGALIDAAFQSLPIDSVWVQYRPANVIAARLCDALGFVKSQAQHSRGTKTVQCIRTLWRPGWRKPSHQPLKGNTMSNVIGFLENAGRDAALRHASREQLLLAISRETIEPALRSALLDQDRSRIDAMLGARDTMHCMVLPVKTPKKAPPKKVPGKAPPKKAPAKKPAKKAPAKRKR